MVSQVVFMNVFLFFHNSSSHFLSHQSQDMSTLAKHLHSKGIELTNPVVEHNKSHSALGLESRKQQVLFDNDASEEESERGSEADQDSATVHSEDSIEMPSILKKKPAYSLTDSVLEEDFSKLNLKDCGIQRVGNLPHLVLFGKWELWDHNSDVMNKCHMMRLHLHPTSKVGDVQLSWVDSKTFQIQLRWPIFMQKCLMMGGLDKDFNKEHVVHNSVGLNASNMRDDNGEIWSEGLFTFNHQMEQEFKDKLFVVEVDQEKNKAAILQIVFEEQGKRPKKAPFSSPQEVESGTIKFSESISLQQSHSADKKRKADGLLHPPESKKSAFNNTNIVDAASKFFTAIAGDGNASKHLNVSAGDGTGQSNNEGQDVDI